MWKEASESNWWTRFSPMFVGFAFVIPFVFETVALLLTASYSWETHIIAIIPLICCIGLVVGTISAVFFARPGEQKHVYFACACTG